jgi:hypothetical protein
MLEGPFFRNSIYADTLCTRGEIRRNLVRRVPGGFAPNEEWI